MTAFSYRFEGFIFSKDLNDLLERGDWLCAVFLVEEEGADPQYTRYAVTGFVGFLFRTWWHLLHGRFPSIKFEKSSCQISDVVDLINMSTESFVLRGQFVPTYEHGLALGTVFNSEDSSALLDPNGPDPRDPVFVGDFPFLQDCSSEEMSNE